MRLRLDRSLVLALSLLTLLIGSPLVGAAQHPYATPDAPEKSGLLKNSKDKEFILRNFKTMYVATRDIDFFGRDDMKAALHRNGDFEKLNITIVDDPRVADVVLEVSYTFAWDYPFELRHQNTTFVLLAGTGEGPFSGLAGAADVARVFADLAQPYRVAPKEKK
jgi:hypothetical protein